VDLGLGGGLGSLGARLLGRFRESGEVGTRIAVSSRSADPLQCQVVAIRVRTACGVMGVGLRVCVEGGRPLQGRQK